MSLGPSIVTRRCEALPNAQVRRAPPGPTRAPGPDGPGFPGARPGHLDSFLNGWAATISAMRVLVVEDEVDLADAVARGLRREGYAVDVAYDGDEALDKLSINEYDVICLDLNLPGTDGIEVTRRLRLERKEPSAPRVLMLTARDQPRDRVVGLDEGADDYLIKPFDFDELKARVTVMTRRRKLAEAGEGQPIETVVGRGYFFL